ncbi:MAG TPA: hypothetical protein PLG58_04880, partial [Flexilinea sp.]|nr:hypothetical protein [Flexilinea sp.]
MLNQEPLCREITIPNRPSYRIIAFRKRSAFFMRGVDKFGLVAASHQPATLCHPKAELKSRLTYLINVYY